MLSADGKSGLTVRTDSLQGLRDALAVLVRDEVLVGVPEETTERPPGVDKFEVTNASLAYIHDNGAPEAKIPARPFMIPGIESVRDKVTKRLARAAQLVLSGDVKKVEDSYQAVGLEAQLAIQMRIRSGVPPPLADSTVRARARKGRKGAQAELNRRAAGYGPSLQLATPLMDTNEMLKSITYVVRNRNRRRK